MARRLNLRQRAKAVWEREQRAITADSDATVATAVRPLLFVAQSVDWVDFGSLHRRIDPEDHSDRHGDTKSNTDG